MFLPGSQNVALKFEHATLCIGKFPQRFCPLCTRSCWLGPKKSIIKMNIWLKNKILSLYNTVTAPVAATRKALAERLQSVRNAATSLYNRAKERLGYVETLKDIVEEQAKKDHQDDKQEEIDLTPQEHEHTLDGAFRSFRSLGLPKADIDTYIDRVKSHIKTLIEDQIREVR